MSPSASTPSPGMPPALTSGQRVIFAQHGWSDTGRYIGELVRSVAPEGSEVIAPSLNFVQTWLRIQPLVEEKEAIAAAALAQHPDWPVRIVAHSMGGLIWTELLHRNPDWWEWVESFVMVGSPIGGSDVARLIDPWGLGIGMARDLGRDRRHLAEQIAQAIPTLVIATDLGNGSDGLVAVEATKVAGAEFKLMDSIPHAAMRYSPVIAQEIQAFWQRDGVQPEQLNPVAEAAIRSLRTVPGMTAVGYRDFPKAKLRCQLGDGITLHSWKNPAQVQHLYLADEAGRCLFAGYVGWGHRRGAEQVVSAIASGQASSTQT